MKSDNTELLVQQATPFALLTNISWVKTYYKYEAKNKLRADEELAQKSETLFGFQQNAKENIRLPYTQKHTYTHSYLHDTSQSKDCLSHNVYCWLGNRETPSSKCVDGQIEAVKESEDKERQSVVSIKAAVLQTYAEWKKRKVKSWGGVSHFT